MWLELWCAVQVGLRRWAENRREVKQKLLQEEATVAARRRLQQIADDQKKSRFTHWLWRWSSQLFLPTCFCPSFPYEWAILGSQELLGYWWICFVSGSFRFILGVQHSRVTSWTGVNLGSSMSLGEELNPSRAVCLVNHWQDRLPKLWPERHCY